MDNQNKNIQDILEAVNFIKDKASTREDLTDLKTDILTGVDNRFTDVDNKFDEIKVEISTSKDEVITKIDSFVVSNQKFEAELSALKSKYDRLEALVMKLIGHLKLEL